MRKWGIFFLLSSVMLSFIWANMNIRSPVKLTQKNADHHQHHIEDKPLWPLYFIEGSLYEWMDQSSNALIQEFGQPVYKAPTPYGYTWWVYPYEDQYIQFGIENQQVVTIYATGPNISIDPVSIGDPYEKVMDRFPLSEQPVYTSGRNQYEFKLSEEDVETRPLIQLNAGTFMQLYVDQFTSRISSVRLLTGDVLIRHQSYEMTYFGELPSIPDLDDDEWRAIEKARERQIFDITNVIRKRHGLRELEWDSQVSEVAYHHSMDMAKNKYFSHFTLGGDGLKERLEKGEIFYLSAGENIAAQYQDAPAVMEGWMNSEGHRKAMLNPDYTHLGVGVYRDYYTQNFLQKLVIP